MENPDERETDEMVNKEYLNAVYEAELAKAGAKKPDMSESDDGGWLIYG